MSNIMQSTAGAAPVKQQDYSFLYSKEFCIGTRFCVPPPWHWIILCLGSVFGYLFCVFVVFPATRPKTREGVLLFDKLRYWHNMALCVFSGFSCFYTIYEMRESGVWDDFLLFFRLWDVQLLKPMMCTDAHSSVIFLNYVFIVSKLYEGLDTGFMVWLKNEFSRGILREEKNKKKAAIQAKSGTAAAAPVAARESTAIAGKKSVAAAAAPASADAELNFLNVYHHATTFWLFLLVSNFQGTLRMGLVMNGFVHLLMYYHYAHPLPSWLVPAVTVSQIGQLIFVTYLWGLQVQVCERHFDFATDHWLEFLTPFMMVPVFLLFFLKYFAERWILPLFRKSKKE